MTQGLASRLLPKLGRNLSRPSKRAQTRRIEARTIAGPYGYTQAKALIFSEYGEPKDVLQSVSCVPPPPPPLAVGSFQFKANTSPQNRLHSHSISPSLPPSQLILRTLAAPINPADINTIQGTYGAKPSFTSALGAQPPAAVPGNEGVFEVLATGSSSSSADGAIQKGDWVIPAKSAFGTWRTHIQADISDVLKIPKDGLSPVQAATVSVNPCTAYRILRSYGPQKEAAADEGLPMRPLELGSGEFFIQNGANSGVGRAAIQLGRAWGLRSINIVRERASPDETAALKDELRALGATHVFTDAEFLQGSFRKTLDEVTRGARPVGLALNCVGGPSAAALAKALGEGGTLVSYGGMGRKGFAVPLGLQIFKEVRSVGFWLTKWNERDPEGRKHAVEYLLDLTRKGNFRDAPVEEVPWEWKTEVEGLRDAVGRGMEGFRGKKGVFVFGET